MREDKTWQPILGCIGLLTVAIFTIVVGTIVNGFVLTMLWQWFVVSVFPNVPTLTIGHAIGLSMVATYFLNRLTIGSDDKKKDRIDREAEPLLA